MKTHSVPMSLPFPWMAHRCAFAAFLKTLMEKKFSRTAPENCKKREEDQEIDGGGREGKGKKKEFRCVMYMYQFHTMNVIIMYCKHIMIKIKIF